jgi:hypothetical protein
MTLRYCNRCACEVEDAGGFCLLGHPLRLEAPIPPVAEMRVEVSRALDEARPEARSPHEGEADADEDDHVMAPREERRRTPAVLQDLATLDRGPSVGPPPPPETGDPDRETVWHALESGSSPSHAADPIAAFSPAPRMDWGPDKQGRLGRKGTRRGGDTATA